MEESPICTVYSTVGIGLKIIKDWVGEKESEMAFK
jgi:hypothetical protein